MKRQIRVIATCAAFGVAVAASPAVLPVAAAGEAPTAKNIIVMIADGAGYNHFDIANLYQFGTSYNQVQVDPATGWVERVTGTPSQRYESYPVQVAQSHYSANGRATYDSDDAWGAFNWVYDGATDSAAAATALSTGVKTNKGVLGYTPAAERLTTIVEHAKTLGKAAGLVTSVPFNHATPAGFVAHNADRNDYHGLAAEMIDSDLNVVMGAGHPLFDDAHAKRNPNYKWISKADYTRVSTGKTPYSYVETRAQFEQLAQAGSSAPERVFGLAQVAETLQYNRPGVKNSQVIPGSDPRNDVPSLDVMAKGALNVLDLDDDGFFLMVEGGAVDWAGHANQTTRVIEEQLEFNAAVEAVDDWVNANSSWEETLVIVTADHETGYLSGLGADPNWTPMTGQAGQLPNVSWHSGNHTNSLVPLFAKGVGSELLAGRATSWDSVRGAYLDNTDTGKTLFDLFGAVSDAGPGRLVLSAFVSGDRVVGKTLAAGVSAVSGAGGSVSPSLSYQWLRGGAVIAKAVGSSYTLAAADAGKRVSVRVTATLEGFGSASVVSGAVAIAKIFSKSYAPTVSDTTPQVGQKLTAKLKAWSPKASFAYQWFVGGDPVAGAVKSTYTVVAGDLGKLVRVSVTGSKSGYGPKVLTSVATKPVALGSLSAKTPTVSGTAKTDSTLTAKTSAWGPSGVTLEYQWLRGGQPIYDDVTGTVVTGTKYKLVAADVGKKIAVRVTGVKPGYKSVSKTSKAKKSVKASLTSYAPSIVGTVKVGNTVSLSVKDWKASAAADDPSVRLDYKWYRGGKKIDGAEGREYTLVGLDAGKKITVKVTGAKDGYTTVTKTSKAKKAASGTFVVDPAVLSVSGVMSAGEALTVDAGVWSPGASLSYKWYVGGKAVSEETYASYVLRPGDVGKPVKVTVTGKATGYTSKSVSATVLWPYAATGALAVAGDAQVGQSLAVRTGVWSPVPSFKYQWLRGGEAISKATKASYKLVAADRGKNITVKVTVSKSGYVVQSAQTLGPVGPVS